jgi:hypothetical protein
MTVAFLMSVTRDSNGRYVLGKGSAFGVEKAPSPGMARLAAVAAGAGDADGAGGAGAPDRGAEAHPAIRNSNNGFSVCIDEVKEGGEAWTTISC